MVADPVRVDPDLDPDPTELMTTSSEGNRKKNSYTCGPTAKSWGRG